MPKYLPDPDAIWTEGDARTVLAAWRRTKQPLGTFARENGLVANRLYWWRKRLSEPTQTMEFLPALMTGDEPTEATELMPALIVGDAEVAIVLRVTSKVTIEIAKASPRMIAEIVGELARTS